MCKLETSSNTLHHCGCSYFVQSFSYLNRRKLCRRLRVLKAACLCVCVSAELGAASFMPYMSPCYVSSVRWSIWFEQLMQYFLYKPGYQCNMMSKCTAMGVLVFFQKPIAKCFSAFISVGFLSFLITTLNLLFLFNWPLVDFWSARHSNQPTAIVMKT